MMWSIIELETEITSELKLKDRPYFSADRRCDALSCWTWRIICIDFVIII
jgi:hypothetical protein